MAITAIDFGYGFTKGKTTHRQTIMRSTVGPAELIRFESDLHRANGSAITVQVNGRAFFVGDYASLQSRSTAQTLDPTRTGSDEQKALFYALASDLVKTTDAQIDIVTGLPVADFDPANMDRLRAMLTGDHLVEREGKRARRFSVRGVYLVPQAVGALFGLILDRRGQIVDDALAAGRVGIVDVGTLTTNFVLVDRLRYVETGSDSITSGMAQVLGQVAKDLKRDHGLDWTLHPDRVDLAVRSRSVEVYGETVRIDHLVEQHARALADTVIARARSLWGSGADLRGVVLTGGGSVALRPYLAEAWPHTVTGDDPQFGNVTGYYRAGLRRFGNGE